VDKRVGLLIDFNVELLKAGISRIANGPDCLTAHRSPFFSCFSAALRETDPYSTSENLTQSRGGAEEEAKGIG
jgi:hypothetical protein